MHDIKTRDVVKGTIKAIDKSAVAAERLKDAYVRTKNKAEHSVLRQNPLLKNTPPTAP